MAPSTRTRPFSASSAHSHSAAANASINSYFTDRSGVLGLEAGPSKSDRPLPELLNLLLDAAHQSHESRRALHPPTHAYTLFSQRVAGGSSSTGSGGIGPPPPPVGLDASRSLTNLAAHSSVAVYAWGEAPGGSQTHPTAPVTAKNAAAAAAPAAAVVAAPASATNASRYPAAATAATAAGPRAAAATASRGLCAPSPTRLSASTSLPSCQFSYMVDTAKAVTKSARFKTGTATATATAKPAAAAEAAMAGRTTKSAVTKPAAVSRPTVAKGPAAAGGPCSYQHPHPGKKAPRGGSPARGPAPPCRKPLVGEPQAPTRGPPAANGPQSARNASAVKAPPAAKGVSAAAPKGRSGLADGIADEGSEPGVVRRVKSAGSAAPGGSDVAAVGAAVGATEAEAQERGPRQIVRPEVVARALSPWEGAELEVVCLYDSNFQTANRQGQHGVPLRVPVRTHIGPISYLYRWYCKRATQFRTHMTPTELPDAPAMPPTEEPWRSAGGGGDAGVGGRAGGGSTTRCGRPASAGSGCDAAGGAGGGAAAAMWLRKATNMRYHGGPGLSGGGGTIGSAGGGAVACESEAERPVTSNGRRLNCSLDPVISLSELVDLLEDMEIVPQLASRLDITKLFNAAAAAAAAPAASSTATAWQAPASGIHQVAGAAPQRQSCATAAMAAPAASRASTSAARQRPTSATATAAATSAGSKTDPRVVSFSAACSGGGTSPASGPRARPSSAPRVLSKPAAAAAAAAAGNVIPRTQPHPEEVRFPVFKDVLVRLAVAIACVDRPPTASDASPYGWGRTISEGEAVAAVRRLLERMQLYRNDVRGLKHRLDQLARMAKEHAVRAAASRMRYVAVPSPVDAAREVAVAPGPAPPPPCARPGLPGWPLPPWGVLAAAPAPPYMTAVLTEEDQGDEAQYRPAWREFGSVALELGVLQPGELRRCRLLLHSRGPHALSVRIDASDAPFCDVSHVGLHSVPYGMPLRVDVTVRLYDLGEVVGELRLRYSSSQDRREREVVVPVYGMVCPPGGDGAASGARTRPRSSSERSAMAAKATREPVIRAVAMAALAAAPLGHCGPPRRGPSSSSPPPLSPSSSYLAGYASVSTAEAPPFAPQSSCRGATTVAAAAPAAAAAGAATEAPLATAAQEAAEGPADAEKGENGTADGNAGGDGVDRGAGGVGGGGEAEPPGDASGASPMDGDDGPMGHSRVDVVAGGDIGGSCSGDADTRSTAAAVHVDAVTVIAVPRTNDTGLEHGDASGEFSTAAAAALGPGLGPAETDVAAQSAAVAAVVAAAKAEGPKGKAAWAAETAEPAVAAAAAIQSAAAACGAVREVRHVGGVGEEDELSADRVLTEEPYGERFGSPEPASETSGAVQADAAKGSFFITAGIS